MGYIPTSTSFNFATYGVRAATAATKSINDTFTSRMMDPYFDPSSFSLRESRNSPSNPLSTPLIFAFDVTGSMRKIPHYIVKEGLGVLISEIIKRKIFSNPHFMYMAVGDVVWDKAPLQVSQFETDLKMLDQLEKLYLEGGGGGNNWESYNLPWHFANYHTSCDAFEKENRKGYLFTIGDELPPPDLTDALLRKVYGREQEPVISNSQLLDSLHSKYEVFHLMIEEGSYMMCEKSAVVDKWTDLLGQRAIPVSDYKNLSEIIISTMQITEGATKTEVISSWKGDTSLVVSKAVNGLVEKSKGTQLELLRF
jgi:hypothetical protein